MISTASAVPSIRALLAHLVTTAGVLHLGSVVVKLAARVLLALCCGRAKLWGRARDKRMRRILALKRGSLGFFVHIMHARKKNLGHTQHDAGNV